MPEHDLPLPRLYDDAEQDGIRVRPIRFESRTALIRPDGLLAIDYSKIKTQADERAILLEEIGHFVTAAFYPPDAPKELWARQEHRASRFVFEKYYPPKMLAALMATGEREPWQLSEALDLPERFVQEMLHFYSEVRRIDFNALAQTLSETNQSNEFTPISTDVLIPPPAQHPPQETHNPSPPQPPSPLTPRQQQMVRYWAAELLDKLEEGLESQEPVVLHAADGSWLFTPGRALLPAVAAPAPTATPEANRALEAEALLEDWRRRAP